MDPASTLMNVLKKAHYATKEQAVLIQLVVTIAPVKMDLLATVAVVLVSSIIQMEFSRVVFAEMHFIANGQLV